MSWVFLATAGVLEVVWAVGLKHAHGFTRPGPSLVTIGAMIASFYLLSLALRTLPLGAAYAIWVGIGAVGTLAASALIFAEPLTPLKLFSAVLIVAGIVGLKLAAST